MLINLILTKRMYQEYLINLLEISGYGISAGVLRSFVIYKRRTILFVVEILFISTLFHRVLSSLLSSHSSPITAYDYIIIFFISIFAVDILEVIKSFLDYLKSPSKINLLVDKLINILKLLKTKK